MRDAVIHLVTGMFGRGAQWSLSDTDSLLENGILDSLGFLELVRAVERNFQVQVEPEELSPENFDSIAGLTAYLEAKRGSK